MSTTETVQPILSKEVWALKRRADDGDVQAMLQYAEILENGEDAPLDLRKAKKYYKRAALNGNEKAKNAHLRLKNKLHQMKQDHNTNDNEKEDVLSIKRKADDGDVQAMMKYADLIEKGEDTPTKTQTVGEFRKDALEKGNQEAENINNLAQH